MFKIGVLVSGGGTNLGAIIDKIKSGKLQNVQIVSVVSDVQDAYALKRAENNNIPSKFINRKDYDSKESYELALVKHFKELKTDLIVLAGFMRILGNTFIGEYENKIINIHPSLIPSFCGKGYYGLKVHEEVLKKGVKITGATVHFVTLGADEGPIIIQRAVEIQNDDTPEILQKRVMEQAEWEILSEAIKLISENKVEINGNVTKVLD